MNSINLANLQHLFAQQGFTDTQYRIFVMLYKYGPKPASTIAKMIDQERTNIYKSCEVMTKRGLLGETVRGGVKHFFVPDVQVIQRLIDQQRELVDQSAKLIPLIEMELADLGQQSSQSIPAMRFYEGKSGLDQCFDDFYDDVVTGGYIVIKLFATNTLDSQSSSLYSLHDYGASLFNKLHQHHVTVQSYLGSGVLILESLIKTSSLSDISDLPAGNSAINCFVFGDLVYVIIYKSVPIAWRMRSEEFAQMLHFLLKLR